MVTSLLPFYSAWLQHPGAVKRINQRKQSAPGFMPLAAVGCYFSHLNKKVIEWRFKKNSAW
jgi:hypothetical protein